jgi:prepilin-type N-terminal cleavage/methylation domain-containing protein
VRHRKNGFSLIELLIVVAIILIIAAACYKHCLRELLFDLHWDLPNCLLGSGPVFRTNVDRCRSLG